MTQDEIIEMANDAELCHSIWIDDPEDEIVQSVIKFAKLVEERTAAKEREACAKVCEDERNDPDDQFKNYEDTHDDGWIDGCNSCIEAIRARGQE